jgi:hypothetical protein
LGGNFLTGDHFDVLGGTACLVLSASVPSLRKGPLFTMLRRIRR